MIMLLYSLALTVGLVVSAPWWLRIGWRRGPAIERSSGSVSGGRERGWRRRCKGGAWCGSMR